MYGSQDSASQPWLEWKIRAIFVSRISRVRDRPLGSVRVGLRLYLRSLPPLPEVALDQRDSNSYVHLVHVPAVTLKTKLACGSLTAARVAAVGTNTGSYNEIFLGDGRGNFSAASASGVAIMSCVGVPAFEIHTIRTHIQRLWLVFCALPDLANHARVAVSTTNQRRFKTMRSALIILSPPNPAPGSEVILGPCLAPSTTLGSSR